MNQTKMANTIAELVFIPATALGHIMSTVEVAKLLVNRDQRLSLTILVIKPLLGSEIARYVESLTNSPTERIRFVELPQGETPPKFDPEAPMAFLNDYMKSHCKYVRDVVGEMMKRTDSGRIAGFVVDVFCTGMMDVADEFGVPTYVFFTSNAAFLGFNLCIQTLCESGNHGVAEFNNPDAEFVVTGFVNPVSTKVFPGIYQTKDGLDFLRSSVRKMKEAKGILVNTFLELETHAIESFSALETNDFPTVYPVGPILNLNGVAAKPLDSDIIGWLDGQQPSSVVFLCFGSMGTFGEVQVKEIAHALERSGRPFIWSLRQPPPVLEQGIDVRDYRDPGVVLPEGFMERTIGAGRVIGWAPQAALLAHPAVGGFVSHCGWNSVFESLWFGVPLATWPMYAEQQLNAFELVVELGLAVEITLDYKKDVFAPDVGDTVVVTAEEIERGIRQVMEDVEVRGKVKEMSRKSREAIAKEGSSFTSIGHLVHEFLSNIS
ncbi:hypothetical protein OSB04_013162 [Centaurea solstitialis]|uniref:Glycosyltransferase n=1 Tax=Centaurea solstitialis TaxID=347529 RepID=A0AA38TXG6_9ASTR|nr:hypothetical protein OSB04_013162 [Centaurea solstitialis]